eukprot:CAMPEP_0113844564 /NCGR_PEP_ID=MMETSP0372-20130328/301_1 /TAXON_ID=340204 /ORGANISM="Lankesteria abbotti" /LENGTH=297 /DNA_ID=CAMNT_0000813569 /DNA_START=145 /DNA_END=1035 /DNA_ORIENTATION=- /assembly_acc=CAM_ASM_000359
MESHFPGLSPLGSVGSGSYGAVMLSRGVKPNGQPRHSSDCSALTDFEVGREWSKNNLPLCGRVVKRTLKDRIRPVLGMLLTAFCSVLFSVCGTSIKLAAQQGGDMMQLSFVRSVVQAVSGLSVCLATGENPFGAKEWRPMLVLRGAVGSGSLFLYTVAIAGMNMGDACSIFFTSPLYATVIAYFWFHETVACYFIASTFASFCGVILVARPSFLFGSTDFPIEDPNISHAVALICTFFGSISSGAAAVIARRIGMAASVSQMVFYFGLTGALGSLVMAFVLPTAPTAWEAYGNLNYW